MFGSGLDANNFGLRLNTNFRIKESFLISNAWKQIFSQPTVAIQKDKISGSSCVLSLPSESNQNCLDGIYKQNIDATLDY